MLSKIRALLKRHLKIHPGSKVVRVTITRWYEIPAGNSTPDKELMNEWFKEYPLSRHHAYRESSVLLEHVTGFKVYTDITGMPRKLC